MTRWPSGWHRRWRPAGASRAAATSGLEMHIDPAGPAALAGLGRQQRRQRHLADEGRKARIVRPAHLHRAVIGDESVAPLAQGDGGPQPLLAGEPAPERAALAD